jgi:hypothetical protein
MQADAPHKPAKVGAVQNEFIAKKMVQLIY